MVFLPKFKVGLYCQSLVVQVNVLGFPRQMYSVVKVRLQITVSHITFRYSSQNVYVFPDACPILKNRREALLILQHIVDTAKNTDIAHLEELQAKKAYPQPTN